MAVASRGAEKISTGRLSPVKPVSTVPGNGGVEEDASARAASDRSAAEYTRPQTERFGG
jgi:hypothetical protein